MDFVSWLSNEKKVALRKESVDRNLVAVGSLITLGVALRKESVDRNYNNRCQGKRKKVALRKESVDRNVKSSVK